MNISFNNASEAQLIVDNAERIINTYGYTTESDIKTLLGLPTHHTGDAVGWTSITDFKIEKTAKGWELTTPDAKPIEDLA